MRIRAIYLLWLLVPVLWPAVAHSQGTSDTARSVSESGLTLAADVFCSQAKLRTSSVRLSWTLSTEARSTAKFTTLAAAKQTLDTTVYAGGFEKGLYVSLPVPAGSVAKPVAPSASAAAQTGQTIRAFQIRLIEAGPARATAATPAGDAREFTAVVEDLEPGVNYTWRLTIETAGGRLVSAPITTQAPTCPADMFVPGPASPQKPPARRRK